MISMTQNSKAIYLLSLLEWIQVVLSGMLESGSICLYAMGESHSLDSLEIVSTYSTNDFLHRIM